MILAQSADRTDGQSAERTPPEALKKEPTSSAVELVISLHASLAWSKKRTVSPSGRGVRWQVEPPVKNPEGAIAIDYAPGGRSAASAEMPRGLANGKFIGAPKLA